MWVVWEKRRQSNSHKSLKINGADGGIRTPDPLITRTFRRITSNSSNHNQYRATTCLSVIWSIYIISIISIISASHRKSSHKSSGNGHKSFSPQIHHFPRRHGISRINPENVEPRCYIPCIDNNIVNTRSLETEIVGFDYLSDCVENGNIYLSCM